MADLIELRKLRKHQEGIDAQKLSRGDRKKRKRTAPEEQGGLRKGAVIDPLEDEECVVHPLIAASRSYTSQEQKRARQRRRAASCAITTSRSRRTRSTSTSICAFSVLSRG